MTETKDIHQIKLTPFLAFGIRTTFQPMILLACAGVVEVWPEPRRVSQPYHSQARNESERGREEGTRKTKVAVVSSPFRSSPIFDRGCVET